MYRVLLLAAAATTAAFATDYLPLQQGNVWTYRSGLNETFQIRVGTPLATQDGSVYYRLIGYATEPLWVRRGLDGSLYWLNEEANREEPLASFRGEMFQTPVSAPCVQTGQAQQPAEPAKDSGKQFEGATEILYRTYGCADIGVQRETWVDNVGMIERVTSSFAGPRTYKLVSARVGNLTYSDQPNVQFRLAMPSSVVTRSNPGEPTHLEVKLSLEVNGLDSVHLRYNTSQRFDVAVKNEAGDVVYLWSSTALFLHVIGEENVVSKEYVVPISPVLEPGRYQVEAWLTTDSRDRQFAATASLLVQ